MSIYKCYMFIWKYLHSATTSHRHKRVGYGVSEAGEEVGDREHEEGPVPEQHHHLPEGLLVALLSALPLPLQQRVSVGVPAADVLTTNRLFILPPKNTSTIQKFKKTISYLRLWQWFEHQTKKTIGEANSTQNVEANLPIVHCHQAAIQSVQTLNPWTLEAGVGLHVGEGRHDEGPDAGAANGDAGDEGSLLVEILRDTVQPGSRADM